MIEGDASPNELLGGDRRDTILGFAGNDYIEGRGGSDSIEGGIGSDYIYGGDGNDAIYGDSPVEDPGSLGPEDTSDDTLIGNEGNDSLYGGLGDDYFVVGEETIAEIYDGGSGNDTLFAGYFSSFESLILDGASSIEVLQMEYEIKGTANANLIDVSGVRNVISPGVFLLFSGNDTFFGSAVGDDVVGGDGNDSLTGNGGNDTLNGEGGIDSLFGGAGGDLIFIGGETGTELYNGGSGNDTLFAGYFSSFESLTLDSAASVEVLRMEYEIKGTDSGNLIDVSGVKKVLDPGVFLLFAGNDTFFGSAAGDNVAGGEGSDYLSGNGGDDILNGEGGTDSLFGGAGDDLIFVGGETGTEIYNGGSGNDTLSAGYFSSFDTLVLDSAASVEFLKMEYEIKGTNTGNLIDISGVKKVIDRAEFLLFDGADTFIGSRTRDEVYAGLRNDTLSGNDGADLLYGEGGDDSVVGGTGRDRLYGGDDSDTLAGGADQDVLEGGAGKDCLVFGPGSGTDRVVGFEDNTDTLWLDDALWGGGLTIEEVLAQFAAASGGDIAFEFADGTKILIAGVADPALLANDILIV